MNRKSQAFFLAAALLAASGCSQSERRFLSRWQGRPAPDFTLLDLQGQSATLSSFRGQPVVVSFFGYG